MEDRCGDGAAKMWGVSKLEVARERPVLDAGILLGTFAIFFPESAWY